MSETEFDSTTLLLQLDRVCDRFEHDWQAGAAPSLEAYLAEFVEQFESGVAGLDPHSPEAKRRGLVRSNLLRTLVENLLGIEVEYRRRAGEEIPWESYRHRFRSFPTAVANARSKARAEETRTDDFQLAQSAVVPEDHAPESHQVHEGVELPPRFEFRGVLGEGTFGVVCQAWDRTLQRQVAVKSPKSTAIRRDLFLREARAASRLRHPHIVRVYDILQLEERTYIVSDFIEGNDLRAVMSSRRFTPRQACALMIKIADAIQYSHEAGVVHRDLKPGNILLDFQDEPHILDFGLSQSLQPSGDSLAVTGKAMGTPAYMPPEQVVGDVDQIGPRSDVYALGVILFQLLTNELPYAGSSSQIFSEVLSKDPTPPRRRNRGIPAALEAICLRAMARAPAARYPSAANFAQDLQRFLAGRRVTAYPHWDWRAVCGFGRRHRVLLGGAALLAISFAAARAWLPPEIAAPPRQTVMIESIPPGAELTWTRLDVNATTGQPAAVGKISTGVPAGSARHFAGRPVALEPGFYKVVAQADDEYFEVYRTVPVPRQMPLLSLQGVPQRHRSFQWDGDVARLPAIRLIPAAQLAGEGVDLPGGTVTIPNDPYYDLAVRGKSVAVSNFRIDRREVTFGQLRAAFPQIHGLPAEDDSVAAYAIPYDVAVAYAEAVGKNLPTIWEMIWAASNQGTTRFSWGSQQPDLELVAIAADPSRFPDRTPGPEPIFDLQLGRVEWTETFRVTLVLGDQQIPGSLEERIVYGALLERDPAKLSGRPWPLACEPGVYEQTSRPTDNTGFRCVRRAQ